MRKLLLGVVTCFVAFGMNSCKKDEVNPAPTLTFIGGAGYTTGDVSVGAGSTIMIGLNANSEKGTLTNFKIKIGYNGTTAVTVLDSTINTANFKLDSFMRATQNVVGTEDWEISVTDKEGQSKVQTLKITTTSNNSPIATYSAKLLGNQSNATVGSFLSTSTGTIYNQADAKANASMVDILYYHGATNGATLAAPNDSSAATIYNNGTTGLQTWSTKNNTKFEKTTLTATMFDAMINDAGFSNYTPNLSKANALANGDVFAFKTAAGKRGFVKVKTITGTAGTSGSVEIDVKVQQ